LLHAITSQPAAIALPILNDVETASAQCGFSSSRGWSIVTRGFTVPEIRLNEGRSRPPMVTGANFRKADQPIRYWRFRG